MENYSVFCEKRFATLGRTSSKQRCLSI